MSNIWRDPVFNRRQSDIDHLLYLLSKMKFSEFTEDEKADWLSGEKGALNRTDLERIKNNIELLNEVLELPTTVPNIPDLPQVDFYNSILNDVQAIRNCNYKKNSTPRVPAQPLNTFSKWNDIEKILYDVYDVLVNNFHYYCGGDGLFAGDSIGLLL